MAVQILHYKGFTIADQGYPRGALATMPLVNGDVAELHAEWDEDISKAIDDWWLEHGQDEVRASGEAADAALEKLTKPTREFFTSADGSTRCRACGLHPDTCTCHSDHPLRQMLDAWRSWLDRGDVAARDEALNLADEDRRTALAQS